MGGSGNGPNSSLQYDDHAYLYDPGVGGKIDITPTAHRADASDLNDRGEVIGFWSDDTSYHPFRRSADGVLTDFLWNSTFSHQIVPAVINNEGHAAGMINIWGTVWAHIPWFSESGSRTVALPYPDSLNSYNAVINDINDHDVIVGYYHKANTPLETTALRWTKQGGTWVAEDLIDLLDDNQGFILDRAIAVNDAGYIICTGHVDGGPDNSWNTHRLLLTPLHFRAPVAITRKPTNIRSHQATLSAKINACNDVTTGMFQHGTSTGYGINTPIAPFGGTLPQLVSQTLTGLLPHTTYHYRASATNAAGTAYGSDESFTTAWDWPSWASANLGGATDPEGDANGNGSPDVLDYATGNNPTIAAVFEGGSFKVTFHRLASADGMTLTVQVSEDLKSWTDGSSYSLVDAISDTTVSTEVSRISDGGEGECITVDISGSVFARFVRLKAVLQ